MGKQANQPAFPADHQTGTGPGHPGLTKREYFAAMALQGILANPSEPNVEPSFIMECVASVSVRYADALLAELEKEQTV